MTPEELKRYQWDLALGLEKPITPDPCKKLFVKNEFSNANGATKFRDLIKKNPRVESHVLKLVKQGIVHIPLIWDSLIDSGLLEHGLAHKTSFNKFYDEIMKKHGIVYKKTYQHVIDAVLSGKTNKEILALGISSTNDTALKIRAVLSGKPYSQVTPSFRKLVKDYIATLNIEGNLGAERMDKAA